MERDVILWARISADGFLADETGSLRALKGHGMEDWEGQVKEQLKEQADTVILGRGFYDDLVQASVPWPFEGMECYVGVSGRYREGYLLAGGSDRAGISSKTAAGKGNLDGRRNPHDERFLKPGTGRPVLAVGLSRFSGRRVQAGTPGGRAAPDSGGSAGM